MPDTGSRKTRRKRRRRRAQAISKCYVFHASAVKTITIKHNIGDFIGNFANVFFC